MTLWRSSATANVTLTFPPSHCWTAKSSVRTTAQVTATRQLTSGGEESIATSAIGIRCVSWWRAATGLRRTTAFARRTGRCHPDEQNDEGPTALVTSQGQQVLRCFAP